MAGRSQKTGLPQKRERARPKQAGEHGSGTLTKILVGSLSGAKESAAIDPEVEASSLSQEEQGLRGAGVKIPTYEKPGFWRNLLTKGAAGTNYDAATARAGELRNTLLADQYKQGQNFDQAQRLNQMEFGNRKSLDEQQSERAIAAAEVAHNRNVTAANVANSRNVTAAELAHNRSAQMKDKDALIARGARNDGTMNSAGVLADDESTQGWNALINPNAMMSANAGFKASEAKSNNLRDIDERTLAHRKRNFTPFDDSLSAEMEKAQLANDTTESGLLTADSNREDAVMGREIENLKKPFVVPRLEHEQRMQPFQLSEAEGQARRSKMFTVPVGITYNMSGDSLDEHPGVEYIPESSKHETRETLGLDGKPGKPISVWSTQPRVNRRFYPGPK